MFKEVKFDKEKSEVDDFGVAISEEYGVAVAGDYGVAIVGTGGVAKAGDGGVLLFIDASGGEKVVHTAYVGVEGILPDQFYEFDGLSLQLSNFEQ